MAVTWNPSDSGAAISFSNGNLTATATSAANKSVRATTFGNGLVYWETTVSDTAGGVGIADTTASVSTYIGIDIHGFGYQPSTGNVLFNNAVAANIGTASAGAVIRHAFNRTTKKYWIQAPSGTWNGSGTADPVTGIGGADTSGFTGEAYATASPLANGAVTTANFDGPFTFAIPSGFSAYDPASYQALTPSLFTNTATFYAPTVTRGAVSLTPSLFTNTNTFYSPTVSQGSQTLTPSLFSNSNTFYAPTVSVGVVTLTPGLFTNAPTFYGPTVSRGAVSLTPSLFTNSSTFYGPTVARGAVTLSPGLLTNVSAFYAPTVSQASGSQTLLPALFANDNTFFSPSIVAASPQTLLPGLFANDNSFYSATISGGVQPVTPDSRSVTVPPEQRLASAPAEIRAVSVASETRTVVSQSAARDAQAA